MIRETRTTSAKGRHRREEVLPLAEAMAEELRGLPGTGHVAIAGSIRRGRPVVGDIDLLVESDGAQDVVGRFARMLGAVRIITAGTVKASVVFRQQGHPEIQIDLRVVPAESFGAALQYFTGSAQHNIRLRQRAKARGWRLNEYGLFDGETRIAGETEESVYAALGLPWIDPAMREGNGEF